MKTAKLTDKYHVAPQISPEDAVALRDAGFTKVICNRPDEEVPPALQAAAIEAAVRAAGLEFDVMPITHQSMTEAAIAQQIDFVEASDGPVLAYCASGTRCSVIWALGQAGKMPVDEILSTTEQAGYALGHLRPMLEALANR